MSRYPEEQKPRVGRCSEVAELWKLNREESGPALTAAAAAQTVRDRKPSPLEPLLCLRLLELPCPRGHVPMVPWLSHCLPCFPCAPLLTSNSGLTCEVLWSW